MFVNHRGSRRWLRYWSLLLLLGLLAGLLPISASAAPSPAPAALSSQSGGFWYTVQYGDTMARIANRYGTTIQAIMNANSLYNPNFVYVGQRLYIPGSGYSSGACTTYYRVQTGDTLRRIASRYGVNMYDIAQANNIYNLERIFVGQQLCIPGASTAPAPPSQDGGFWYTVQYGDTLAKVAYRYGTTSYAIVSANQLANPNVIYVGQRLWIPGGSLPPAPPPQPQYPDYPPHPQYPEYPSQPQTGPWTGYYYPNRDLGGSAVLVRQDAEINFDWYTGSPAYEVPADNFSVRWIRTFDFTGGTYRFHATADDGVRVFVDDHPVIDAWRIGPATSYFGDHYLSPGTHTIRVEYFEATEIATIRVSWTRLH